MRFDKILIVGRLDPQTALLIEKLFGVPCLITRKEMSGYLAVSIIARANAEGAIPIVLIGEDVPSTTHLLNDLLHSDTFLGRPYILFGATYIESALLAEGLCDTFSMYGDHRVLILGEEDLLATDFNWDMIKRMVELFLDNATFDSYIPRLSIARCVTPAPVSELPTASFQGDDAYQDGIVDAFCMKRSKGSES